MDTVRKGRKCYLYGGHQKKSQSQGVVELLLQKTVGRRNGSGGLEEGSGWGAKKKKKQAKLVE